jgi:branched-chain amino acid transport system substrate-binding protein
MRAMTTAAGLAAGLSMMWAVSAGADTIKVGVIGPMSGPFAYVGKDWANTIAAFQKAHGSAVKGHTIEVIYRDLPEINPGRAKALAQELVIKDKVQYLGGLFFTPDALAVGQVAQESKTPTVIFNAATWHILDKSEYQLRTSFTLPQVSVPVAKYALEKGIKKVVTLVSDFAPGLDAENAFISTFTAGGGQVVEKIRVPLKATDFGPFMQTAKGASPDAIFMFMPGGQTVFGTIKAYNENGLKAAGIRLLGTGETMETELPALGDAALGVETGYHYSPAHPSPANQAFLKSIAAVSPDAIVTVNTVAVWDGMTVIYKMIENTNGAADGAKAIASVKGMKWESPRGPVMIDAKTRALVQNVYMRVVDRDASGKLYNREFQTLEMQPDYGPLLPAPK